MFYEVPTVDTVALVDAIRHTDRHTALCLAEWARHVAQAWTCQDGTCAVFGSWLHADLAGRWAARSGLSVAAMGRLLTPVKMEARRAA